jgi:hypothetical protein
LVYDDDKSSVGIKDKINNDNDDFIKLLAQNNWIHCNSFLVDKDLARTVSFDCKALAHVDWHFVLDCASIKKLHYLNKFLVILDRRKTEERKTSITNRFINEKCSKFL